MAHGRGARFRICITEQAIRDQLAALLSDLPVTPLEFASAMDLTDGFGRRFARHILSPPSTISNKTNSIMASPTTVTSFEQFIVGELLQHDAILTTIRKLWSTSTARSPRAT